MKRMMVMAGLLAALAGGGDALALSDIDKKLCLVLAAAKAPVLPGGVITAAKVDDASGGAPEVLRILAAGGYEYAKQLSDSYYLFTDAQLQEMRGARDRGDFDGAKRLLAKALEAFSAGAAMADITVKAGPLEATYGFACLMAHGSMIVKIGGLLR